MKGRFDSPNAKLPMPVARLLTVLALLSLATPVRAGEEPPNILIVLVDDKYHWIADEYQKQRENRGPFG